MSEPYPGLFGAIHEASAIKEKLGVSITKAFKIQRRASAERCKEEPVVESNVIYVNFGAKHDPEAAQT